MNNTILITGCAGFIGFHLSKELLKQGNTIIGLDNLNEYYDVELKKSRLKILQKFSDFQFVLADLVQDKLINELFGKERPRIVINLAAQAGVRYSIEAPRSYIDSNLIGFFHILEACRKYPVAHLIFASSSSVYGNQRKTPFSVHDPANSPVSLYAATKKSNEMMAYSYSYLYKIPVTGLRFFTVYGPFGRPDMAYYSFTKKIIAGEAIKIFNNGELYRDFTYIDDIVTGIQSIIKAVSLEEGPGNRYRLYNIGNNRPQKLTDFIEILEKCLGKKAVKEFVPMQPGDVFQTYADISDMEREYQFCPRTSLEEGLMRFTDWYKEYYGIEQI